ncbi:Uncharacterised protein [Klebsiella pneumoniae]|nr:Uncharacterised protein [Klebsiella pneumoniae]
MPDHITHAVINHFVGDRHRLFRVTGVIVFGDHQFIAVNAAFGVDVLNRLAGTGKFHITVLCDRSGHSAHHRDFNIFSVRRCT